MTINTGESSATTPAMFDHCSLVYRTLEKSAFNEEYDILDGKGNKIETATRYVYEGYVTRVFQELGLATPYYTVVNRALTGMGCVRQIRRGGGSAKSKWELITAPTEELWESKEIIKSFGPRTRLEQLEQITRDLNGRLKNVERALGI